MEVTNNHEYAESIVRMSLVLFVLIMRGINED